MPKPKPCMAGTTTPSVARLLRENVSKNALIDLYTQSLASRLGACDTPPTIHNVVFDADPMLILRGDPVLDYVVRKNRRRFRPL